jgi:DNA-binding NarL/FixJ family response regulator
MGMATLICRDCGHLSASHVPACSWHGCPCQRALVGFTTREMTILEHVCQGKGYKQIAYDLNIGEKTVAAHAYNMIRKVGVSGKLELILYSVERSLVPISWLHLPKPVLQLQKVG